MSHQPQPCERDDLEMIIPRGNHFAVDEDGNDADFRRDGESGDAECYYCRNCGAYFEPEESDRPRDWGRAWQAALDHLPQPDAPELTVMSCCLPSMSRSTISRRTQNESS